VEKEVKHVLFMLSIYVVYSESSWIRLSKVCILRIIGYITFIPFRHNALVPPPFPLVEVPLKVVFLQAFEQCQLPHPPDACDDPLQERIPFL
jgi:hypothetical protein